MYAWHVKGDRAVAETFGHLDDGNESSEEVKRRMLADGYKKVRIIQRWSRVSQVSIEHHYVIGQKPAAEVTGG